MQLNEYQNIDPYPSGALLQRHEAESEVIALDTETLGYTEKYNIPIYFSFASKYISPSAGPCMTVEGMDFLKRLCASNCAKVFQNCRADLSFLLKWDIEVKGPIYDTLLMSCLIDELPPHGLKELSARNLPYGRYDELEAFWQARGVRNVEKRIMTQVPQQELHTYAQHDARDTYELFVLFKEQLKAQALWELYLTLQNTELVYWHIERVGIRANGEAITAIIPQLEQTLNELGALIYQLFGYEFNINSGAQLAKALIQHGIPLTKKTLKGQYVTDKETLQSFISDPVIPNVLAYKRLSKALSTFRGYDKLIVDGRMYTKYRQTTKTGRAASEDPNLMNIPKQAGRLSEVDIGDPVLADRCAEAFRQVRATFIADDGAFFYSPDYAQGEYKIFAYLSGSERLIDNLKAGQDFHELTAKLVFEDYNKRLRHIIKIINYGLIYGMGEPLLKAKIRSGDPKADPSNVLFQYRRMLPEMEYTQRRIIDTAARRGYVRDVFGRKYRHQPELPYVIVSWLCQGTLANVKKISMERTACILCSLPVPQWRETDPAKDAVRSSILKYLLVGEPASGELLEAFRQKKFRSTLNIDIHDELVFNIYPEEAFLIQEIHDVLQDFPQFGGIPLTVEDKLGGDLLRMKEIDLTQPDALIRWGTEHEYTGFVQRRS